ncbi:hypothetical protein MLD38_013597 [Melastoma candidum]|uniref:Uncharacterized protein n=1 Tax=Melastoma candidum TaxID=119954 RepID=A0ACB9RAP7_9MYRT|nr:hypothetical protein MLD38_013597 [Melastoma candidum]
MNVVGIFWNLRMCSQANMETAAYKLVNKVRKSGDFYVHGITAFGMWNHVGDMQKIEDMQKIGVTCWPVLQENNARMNVSERITVEIKSFADDNPNDTIVLVSDSLEVAMKVRAYGMPLVLVVDDGAQLEPYASTVWTWEEIYHS